MSANTLVFEVGDYVVYPKHGVGRVIELQKSEIAGMQLELYVLRFEKEKMTLRDQQGRGRGDAQTVVGQDAEGSVSGADDQAEGQAHHVVAPRAGI